jgi:hypothetical protein
MDKEILMKWDEVKDPVVLILTPTLSDGRAGEREKNWQLKVQIKDARVCMGKEGTAPIAPETGYLDSILLKKGWEGQRGVAADALLYAKTAGGKYMQIRLSAYSDRGIERNTGAISVRLNPQGGRVFE